MRKTTFQSAESTALWRGATAHVVPTWSQRAALSLTIAKFGPNCDTSQHISGPGSHSHFCLSTFSTLILLICYLLHLLKLLPSMLRPCLINFASDSLNSGAIIQISRRSVSSATAPAGQSRTEIDCACGDVPEHNHCLVTSPMAWLTSWKCASCTTIE